MTLKQRLIKHRRQFSPVLPKEQQFGPAIIIDCSQPLQPHLNRFGTYTLEIGRYAERRVIYDAFQQNNDTEYRNIHLGLDLGVPEFTTIFSPLDAVVHSFADNNQPGDYGPTVILKHQLNHYEFYTLYGHLSRQSLKGLQIDQKIKQGQSFSSVGTTLENGGWPSHLHFQIIDDIEDNIGNYPGICSEAKWPYYQNQCPDPNLILNLPMLEDEL